MNDSSNCFANSLFYYIFVDVFFQSVVLFTDLFFLCLTCVFLLLFMIACVFIINFTICRPLASSRSCFQKELRFDYLFDESISFHSFFLIYSLSLAGQMRHCRFIFVSHTLTLSPIFAILFCNSNKQKKFHQKWFHSSQREVSFYLAFSCIFCFFHFQLFLFSHSFRFRLHFHYFPLICRLEYTFLACTMYTLLRRARLVELFCKSVVISVNSSPLLVIFCHRATYKLIHFFSLPLIMFPYQQTISFECVIMHLH